MGICVAAIAAASFGLIDLPVALGAALHTSGGTDRIARGLVDLSYGAPARAALLLLMVVTMSLSDMLILGPGGYAFGDYRRMGLPLELLVIAVGLPAILIFWPR